LATLILLAVCIWRLVVETRKGVPAVESAFFIIAIAYGIVVSRHDLISIYVVYVFWITLLFILFLVFGRIYNRKAENLGKWDLVSFSLGFLALSGLVLLAPLGCCLSFRNQPPTSIASPLKNGTFFVVQGGSNRLLNHHRTSPVATSQRFAVDFSKLSSFGRRTRALFPNSDLSEFLIFGEPVYSPCNGVILFMADDIDDERIGRTNEEKPAGNYLAIGCEGGHTIVLAHLKKGIDIEKGNSVVLGQQVGYVGNSGNSTEPHLHLHVISGIAKSEYEALFSGDGIEVAINDACLYRNQVLNL